MRFSVQTLLAASLALVATTVAAQTCNGNSNWCSRPYNQASYVTANDAMISVNGDSANATQKASVTTLLANGVRAFVFRVVKQGSDPTVRLCLETCDTLNGGDLKSTLTSMKQWMDANKDAVVTIVLRNVGNFVLGDLAQPFKDAKLDSLVFGGKSDVGAAWPKLGDMVKSNKRCVVFATGISADATLPWIMPLYTFTWESPSQVTSVSGGFTCTKDKPTAGAIPVQNSLYIMNHFVDDGSAPQVDGEYVIPDTSAPAKVNTQSSIESHVTACMTSWGLRPNFISLDFADQGDAVKTVANMNNKKMGNTEQSGETWVASNAAKTTIGAVAALVILIVTAFAM